MQIDVMLCAQMLFNVVHLFSYCKMLIYSIHTAYIMCEELSGIPG